LAAPQDPRQHYVLTARQRALDETWATALDRVLIGSDDDLNQADKSLGGLLGTSSGAGYPQLLELSRQTLEAIRGRDDALASAVAINEWWVRQGRRDKARRADDGVRQLVDGAAKLAAGLDRIMSGAGGDGLAEELNQLTGNLDGALRRLLDLHAQRIIAVTRNEGGSIVETAAETPELLRCAVNFGPERSGLHKQWFDRLKASPLAGGDAPAKKDQSGAKDDLEYLIWLARDGVAPVRQLLDERVYQLTPAPGDSGGPSPTVDEKSSRADVEAALADLGRRLRARLSHVNDNCRELGERSATLMADHPAAEARGGFSQADVLCRALAPLAAGSLRFDPGQAPMERLARLDAQAWILWQGHRAIDDCWGFWDEGLTSGPPYFVRMAESAGRIAAETFRDCAFGVNQLRTRASKMDDVVRHWDPLVAASSLQVDVGAGSKIQRPSFRGLAGMRPGMAAVYLSDDDGELINTYNDSQIPVRRKGLDVTAPDDVELTPLLNVEQVSNVTTLNATALFRGHVRPKAFGVQQGVTIAWRRPHAPASVIVRGDSKQVSQIMFVFDCSGSMDDFERDRIEEGRKALEEIFSQLIKNGEQFQVGLIAFGHRAWWTKEPKPDGTFEYKLHRLAGFPGNTGDDVEVKFPMDALNRQRQGDILAFLGQAKPHGETPLYFALHRALYTIKNNEPGEKHVIAITDGVNRVADIPGHNPARVYEKQDVLDALAERPARIDVVEFGVDDALLRRAMAAEGKTPREINEEVKKLADGRDELRAITDAARGAWQRANDSTKLTEALLESLKLNRYGLRPKPTADAPDFTDLSQPITIPAPNSPTDYEVQLQVPAAQSTTIRVEGGEALELVYRRVQNDLVHDAEPPDDRQGAPQEQKGLRIFAHTPQWTLREPPVFRFSIQSIDESRFSFRPQVVWAKVAEPLDEGRVQNYYFVDREFEPNLKAPVLQLRTPQWSGARLARVDLCFAIEADDLNVPLHPLERNQSKTFRAGSAELEAKMTADARVGLQVVVDERHDADSEDYPLNVQIEPPPDEVERTYFEGDRSVRHVFQFKDDPGVPKLRAVTRREIAEKGVAVTFDAVTLPRR
jgi:hypothetical protein